MNHLVHTAFTLHHERESAIAEDVARSRTGRGRTPVAGTIAAQPFARLLRARPAGLAAPGPVAR